MGLCGTIKHGLAQPYMLFESGTIDHSDTSPSLKFYREESVNDKIADVSLTFLLSTFAVLQLLEGYKACLGSCRPVLMFAILLRMSNYLTRRSPCQAKAIS